MDVKSSFILMGYQYIIMKDYLLAFKKIFNFKDNASIKEFWSFFLVDILVKVLLHVLVSKFSVSEYVPKVYNVISFIVFISIGFRRVKSAGYSGWLFLIPLANLVLASLPEKRSN